MDIKLIELLLQQTTITGKHLWNKYLNIVNTNKNMYDDVSDVFIEKLEELELKSAHDIAENYYLENAIEFIVVDNNAVPHGFHNYIDAQQFSHSQQIELYEKNINPFYSGTVFTFKQG